MSSETLRKYKTTLILIIITITLCALALNYQSVLSTIGWIFGILTPLWSGIVIAYILNIPTTSIENRLKKILPQKIVKQSRGIAILLVIFIAIIILMLLYQIIIPQLITTISQIVENSGSYGKSLNELINGIINSININRTVDINLEISKTVNDVVNSITLTLKNNIPTIINGTLGVTSSLVGTIASFLIGFVISVYLLMSKNELLNQSRLLIMAFLSEKHYKRLFKVCTTANQTFSSFISGQLLDCLALGSLCYVGMLIFNFPYAILVSTLVTSLAIIPYFGAFTGMFIGALLMLPNAPQQSLLFIIYFIVLQQLEGNFVYPRIVGNKVGLPGLWVLVSVILFSGIFGFIGLFFAVPVTAVVYRLLKEAVGERLENKNIPIEELLVKED